MRLAWPLLLLVLMTAVLAATGAGSWLPHGWVLDRRWPDALRTDAAVLASIGFWWAAAWFASRLASLLLFRRARHAARGGRLPRLLADVAAIVIYGSAALIVVSGVFAVPLGGLLATSGVVAAIIGLAIQRTIADVFAGIALNLDQSVRLGDWIELPSGVTGRVAQITWRATQLEGVDLRTVMVPNSVLVANQFINVSAPDRHFFVYRTVSIPHEVSPERVMPLLHAAMAASEGVLTAPPARVRILQSTPNGLTYSFQFAIADYPQQFRIATDVMVQVLRFLDRVGIAPSRSEHDVTIVPLGERRAVQVVDTRTLLHRSPFFRAFPEEVLAPLEAIVRMRDCDPGTVVVREGDPGESLFLVASGLLDVEVGSAAGGLRRVARLIPGDVFGEMSLLTGSARSATVTVASRAVLLELGRAQFEPFLAGHPGILDALSRLQADRIAHNEAALKLSAAEQQEVTRVGLAAFLRDRIGRFLGRSERELPQPPSPPGGPG